MANVSTATVSYVLNNSVGRTISEQTRAAVRHAAAELGYRPNLAARNLARGKSGVVLYIVPRLAGGEMPMQVGTHMTTELTRRGVIQVQLFETEDDDTIADAINQLQPIAVTSLFPLGRKASRAVHDAGIPHICVHTQPGLGDPQYSVGQMRVDHLVSRGHRKLAFACSGDRRWRAVGDYWIDGVHRAARQHGLPDVVVAAFAPDDSATAARELHAAGVTAVCAQSDDVAFVVLDGIRRAGLRCPDDLAVIGVDATALSPFSVPALTTVEFDRTAIADLALSALLAELDLLDEPRPVAQDIATLIVREST
ncbi:LacI family DNA-binding transcriptional regulator [Mycobacterium shigaense]|uniref:LacI family transcriptional regulator n=1 Tax=Mycobacterium shigaense TaxID=722731 RepID=A0A1Z4EKA0_9MYCO|nr:LacI family DNA-binding transcriptional regulator [Mycobacterium shigaense]MEA1124603.1 LacI family DNA-binding transcriptional regulator [Mycobacterium shigaense]BAX93407.1 LacI family transcriptional regulator [Mycobacterium shigaense]